MRANPYQLVEGMIIAAFVVGAAEAYICLKAQLRAGDRRRHPRRRGVPAGRHLPGLPVTVVAGPEEYLFGEEKAMLEVIEGKPPLPRDLPPVRTRPLRRRPAGRLGGPRRAPHADRH